MIIFFSSSSISPLTRPTTSRTASVSRASLLAVPRGGARRRSRCLVRCDLKLDGKKRFSASAAMVASSSTSDEHDISPPRTFLEARTEQVIYAIHSDQKLLVAYLVLGIRKEAEAGRLPVTIAMGMEELFFNYRNAVLQSEHPKADEIVLSNMAVALDRVFMDVWDPFQFSPYHKAIREPFDYYMFGQDYIRPLLDFRSSFLGNSSIFNEMEKKLHQGENIILISNHQTEADPAVISLLLESTNPSIAENMIYIAGDRVVTDPLCKPFSMGRNLLCVYSKKHMNDDPELIDMKKRANMKSLKEMTLLLRGGSKIIWIAPSGGRDRPDPDTKEWYPAPFDASSLENMRRLAEHAGVPGNIYPLAILCHDIMPPPQQVEKEIGEKRMISFHGVGVSVAPSISYHEMATAFEDPEEAKMEYTRLMYSSVCEQYNLLKSAIHGKQGHKASTPHISLSQPWK